MTKRSTISAGSCADGTVVPSMDDVNPETVNDRAKLMMHRLIARRLSREPDLIAEAKAANLRASTEYPDRTFPEEWGAMLDLPPESVRRRLTARGEEMRRLRLSSPFVAGQRAAFLGDPELRRRIWRLARKGVVASAISPTGDA